MRNCWLMWSLVGTVAHAAQWKSQCEQASKSSEQQCQSAVEAFKAADAGRLAAGSAASGTNVNSNSGIQKSAIDGNNADLQKAIAQCQQAKQSCNQQCDQALQQAQAAAANPKMRPIAQPDVAAIPGVKQSECNGKIDPKIAELQAGKSPLDQQSKDSQKTKDESQNGAPQMPQMPKSDSSDTGSSPAAATPGTLNCAVAGGSRFSDCNATFTAKCAASMTANECDAFTNRYCNLSSGADQPALASATTNLVIDKTGEGTGTNFCSYALSYRYCQTAGREQCPSCLKVYAQQSCGADAAACMAESSSAATEKARAACPDDPIFLTGGWAMGAGAFQSTATTGATGTYATGTSGAARALTATNTAGSLLPASVAGYSSGGAGSAAYGGGGTALGGAAATTGAAGEGANREGLPNGLIPESSSGGAVGGSAWINPEEREPAAADVRAAFEGPRADKAGPMVGMSGDVANALGPSVFSVGSTGIRSFCAKNHLTSCTKN